MSWLLSHWLVLTLLTGYVGVMVYHALAGRRETHGVSDYFVGGRSMGGVVLGISFFATYSSTNSFLGFSGQSYAYGAPWLLLAPAAVVFAFIAWRWIAPRLRRMTASLDSITIPDFIGFRFGSQPARVAAAFIVIFASFLYMTAVFKGIGNLLQTFLSVPYEAAIGIVFVIVMVYTVVGGFISVVKTDGVQGVIMVFAALLMFGGTVTAAGGFGSLAEVRAAPETSQLFRWDAAMPFPVLLGLIVAGTMKFLVEPRQLSRFYALKDERAIKTGMWVSVVAFLVVYSMLVPIGLYAHRLLGSGLTDSDLVVPTLLANPAYFGPVVAAFLVLAMVAAAMSSLDSVLLVMASTFARDVIGLRGNPTEAGMLRSTKRWVSVFAAITALIALRPPGGIVDLTAFSGSLYAACFFPAIVLGLYWRRGNGPAVLTSFAVGVGVLLLWKYLPFADMMHRVFPAMLLSTGCYVGIAKLGALHVSDEIEEYFGEGPTAMETVTASAG